MSAQAQTYVSQRSIDLAMRIVGSAKYTYYLEYLLMHFPHARALRGLEWLYSKGIRGKNFEEFVEIQCNGKALEFCKQVFRGMERDSEVKPIYAKDLRS